MEGKAGILIQLQQLNDKLRLAGMRVLELEKNISAKSNEIVFLKNELKNAETENKNLSKNQRLIEKDLENKVFLPKLVKKTAITSSDTDSVKQLLEEYIKELDYCISQLES